MVIGLGSAQFVMMPEYVVVNCTHTEQRFIYNECLLLGAPIKGVLIGRPTMQRPLGARPPYVRAAVTLTKNTREVIRHAGSR